jgi:hypothetical protein
MGHEKGSICYKKVKGRWAEMNENLLRMVSCHENKGKVSAMRRGSICHKKAKSGWVEVNRNLFRTVNCHENKGKASATRKGSIHYSKAKKVRGQKRTPV